jgi:hypothetical protein
MTWRKGFSIVTNQKGSETILEYLSRRVEIVRVKCLQPPTGRSLPSVEISSVKTAATSLPNSNSLPFLQQTSILVPPATCRLCNWMRCSLRNRAGKMQVMMATCTYAGRKHLLLFRDVLAIVW